MERTGLSFSCETGFWHPTRIARSPVKISIFFILVSELCYRLAEFRSFLVLSVQFEYHEVGVLLGARCPLAAVRAVRIAVFCEVGPCGKHLL